MPEQIRCVVSFGLYGLWQTSHTLEVAIVALDK